jgi:hypothetical protein
VELPEKQPENQQDKGHIMNTKGIVALFTTGALAVGLAVGGVTTAALTGDHAHHHAKVPAAISPAVPASPANDIIPSHRIQVLITPIEVFNLSGAKYDRTLFSNPRYEAIPGSYAGDIERAGGQSEQFISHDGNQITIGVAKGDFSAEQQAIAKSATLVGGYNSSVKVYQINGTKGVGDYEVFVGGYWFSLSSNLFTSPQVAAPMIQAALQLVPQG